MYQIVVSTRLGSWREGAHTRRVTFCLGAQFQIQHWEIEPKQREERSSFTGRSNLRLEFRAAYVGSWYGKRGRGRGRKIFNEIMAPDFPTLMKITNPQI